jgi:hypothetical protein
MLLTIIWKREFPSWRSFKCDSESKKWSVIFLFSTSSRVKVFHVQQLSRWGAQHSFSIIKMLFPSCVAALTSPDHIQIFDFHESEARNVEVPLWDRKRTAVSETLTYIDHWQGFSARLPIQCSLPSCFITIRI